jgi:hypothetical protein
MRLVGSPSLPMAKTPPNVSALDMLSVPERLLLFCVGSLIDPAKAGITHRTIELMIIKGLIKRGDAALALAELGRATLDALLLNGRK